VRFERSGGFGGRRFGGGRGFGRGGGGFRNDRFSDEPKPVKVGEEYDVEITETGSRGDGIARVNNFVVFVNGAKQGEKTKIKITDVRNRFAIGEKAGALAENGSEGAPAEAATETVADEGEEGSEESGEESEDEDKE
jgi:predicted RNA-binding protein with TRAM domain